MITLNNKQARINGRKIALADTPEARLKYLDKKEIDLLAALGVNAITCTVRGGDVRDITPYISNNPANDFDFVKLGNWLDYISYANYKGIIPFLMLSEKENHFNISIAQEKELIKTLVDYFKNQSVIWTKEEYPTGNDTRLRDVFTLLNVEIFSHGANHLIALHNNTDEVNWIGHNEFVDLIQVQTKLATGNATIKKAFDAGYAVIQSELVGGNNTGNTAAWCTLGEGMSSGAGLFFPVDDLKAPQYIGTRLKYEPEYKIMVRELGGTITPPIKEPITSKTLSNKILTLNNSYKLQLI